MIVLQRGLPRYCYRKKQRSGAEAYVMYVPNPDRPGTLRSHSYGNDLQRMLADWADIWGDPGRCFTLGELMDKYQAQQVPLLAPQHLETQLGEDAHLRIVLG